MRVHTVQSSFLSGVLDPRASARIDTDAYQQGMLVGKNIEPVHLGGIRVRRGTLYKAVLPNALTRVTGASLTATAPRGGTANNAKDNDATTALTTVTNISTIDPYIVVHYDLGSAKAILFADVLGIVSTGSGSSGGFEIQYSSDDSAWTTFDTALQQVNATVRSYRRKGPVTARYWRLAKIGAVDMGSNQVQITDFTLWQDAGTISECRAVGFEVSSTARYLVVLTDFAGSIFNDGVLVCSVPLPYAQADLSELDGSPNSQSMVLVHDDYPPRYLQLESGTNFQTQEITFQAIPQVDFNDIDSPAPTSEVQVITFTGGLPGDTFQIDLDNAKSGTIAFAGDADADHRTTTAANIAAAVQKLFSVPGFTGVSCVRTGTLEYTVTFAAGSAKPYGMMSVLPLDGAVVATVARTTAGVARSEPAWSTTRGYPRSVTFFESRMYFGGTRSLQESNFGSEVNNTINFLGVEGLADEALFTTITGQSLNAINALYSGRSLQLFTTGGEFRYVKPQGTPIVPGDAPANQTQYGCAKIRPVSIDGATLFIQRNRKSVRDFRYDYTEDAFNSLGVSSLAPALIYDVKDLAVWNGSAIDEINFVLVVNGTNPDTSDDALPDGTIAIFNSRKEANVQAWTWWETDGEYKAVGVVLQDIFVVVKRTIGGIDFLLLEKCDPDVRTDCAVVYSGVAADSASGLDHLDGEECRVKGNGFVLRNKTPVAGAIDIERSSTLIEVGLDYNPVVQPMPLNANTSTGPTFLKKNRIVSARVKIRNTLGLLINGKKISDRKFDVNSFDEPAAIPVSGVADLKESTNWDLGEKLITYSQVDPLPLEILGHDIALEVGE